MNFGSALELLKTGAKLARAGWNGRGMFVIFRAGANGLVISSEQIAHELGKKMGDTFEIRPHFWLKNLDGSYFCWVPSINDLLAEDWEVLTDVFGASKSNL